MSTTNILEIAKSGAAEDLRKEMRAQADASLYYFAKVILGYDKLVDYLHLPFCQHLQSTQDKRKRGYLYPRGHFKSTIFKSYILWRVIKDPNIRVLGVGEADKIAAKNLRDIKWHILNNEIFRWLYPEIIPEDINKTKWTDNEILLPRSKTFDESTITTVGVGAKHTGFHYDIVGYDDPIGLVAAQSEPEMQQAIEWFQMAPGLLHDPETSEEIVFGTRWKYGDQDIYGWAISHMPYKVSSNGKHSGFVWHVRSAIENDKSIFPDRFSLETLEQIRQREGDYKFSCNYLNEPIPDLSGSLDITNYKRYTVSNDGKQLIPEDGTPSVLLSELHRVCIYDPSGGGAFAKSKDALAGVGMSSDRRIFVLLIWEDQAGFARSIHRWQLYNDSFRFHTNKFEAVGAYKSIGDLIAAIRLQDNCENCSKDSKHPVRHRPLIASAWRPEGGNRGASKEDRIRLFMQVALEEGRIYLRTTGMSDLIQQTASLGVSSRVDGLDACATGISHLKLPDSFEDIETEKYDLAMKHQQQSSRIDTEFNYGGYV